MEVSEDEYSQVVQELRQENENKQDHSSTTRSGGNLQEKSCPVEIRIQMDDNLAQLGHNNLSSANIIIGETDGVNLSAGSQNGQSISSVSLERPEELTSHQLQTHQLQQVHHHHHDHSQQQYQQNRQVTVIMVPGLPQLQQNSMHQNPITTWEEVGNAAVLPAVLPIRCRDTDAELHKAKFEAGNKGKCIKLGDQWLTPIEFEARTNRGICGHWQHAIRSRGRRLQALIDDGYLVPHERTCECSVCVGDSSVTKPHRIFRKRKNEQGDSSKPKLRRLLPKDSKESSDVETPVTVFKITPFMNPSTQALMNMSQASSPTDNGGGLDSNTNEVGTPVTLCGITPSMNPLIQGLINMNQASIPTDNGRGLDSNTDDSPDIGTPLTLYGITPSMNPLTQAQQKNMNQASPPTMDEAWRNLEDMAEKMTQAALLMKDMVKNVKERTHHETGSLRSQIHTQQEVQNLPQSQQAQQQLPAQINVDTRNLIETPMQTYSIEVLLDPENDL